MLLGGDLNGHTHVDDRGPVRLLDCLVMSELGLEMGPAFLLLLLETFRVIGGGVGLHGGFLSLQSDALHGGFEFRDLSA